MASGTALIAIASLVLSAGGLQPPAAAALGLGILELAAGTWPAAAHRVVAHLPTAVTMRSAAPRNRVLLVYNGLALSLLSRAASGDGLQTIHPLASPLWLAAIALVCAGCWERTPRTDARRWTRLEVSALVLLTAVALAVRASHLGTMPYVLSGDEGSAGLTAWEFQTGARNNLLGLGWFYFPSLYFGLLSFSQGFFGRTVEAIRGISAVAGALTIPALYWTARPMFGRLAAFGAATWLAAFHVHVLFSRVAYNNIFDGLLFTLAAGALWRGWQDGDRRAFVLAGLSLGFSQYFYTTSHLTPILLAVWAVLLGLDRRPDRARLLGLTASLLVALTVFLPLGLLYAAHPDTLFFTASRVSMILPGWTSEAAAALGTTWTGLVLEQIWVTALGLTVAELQGVYSEPGVPMLISVSAVLFLAGVSLCVLRCRNPRYSLPLLVVAGTILVAGMSIEAPSSQRMLFMSPSLAVMVTLPLEQARAWSARRWPGGTRALAALAGILLVIMVAQNVDHLFRRYFPREEYGSLHGAVTQAIIDLWPELPPDVPVYFFGGGRMQFASIPSLAYLRPEAHALDLDRPDQIPADPPDLIAIVLPPLAGTLQDLQVRFPEGVASERYNRQGRLLFYLFVTGEAARASPSALP